MAYDVINERLAASASSNPSSASARFDEASGAPSQLGTDDEWVREGARRPAGPPDRDHRAHEVLRGLELVRPREGVGDVRREARHLADPGGRRDIQQRRAHGFRVAAEQGDDRFEPARRELGGRVELGRE